MREKDEYNKMIINLDKHDFSIMWHGVYFKALSDYPSITDWEMKSIIDFIEYERSKGRETSIEANDVALLNKIHEEIEKADTYSDVERPNFISECTACKQKGCLTDYICHVASLENAKKIIESGSLLSALKARSASINELIAENRNAAKDPKDFFEYIMFSWGNCQAGDRLVMERALERMPSQDDLSINFKPGVRFYFKYDKLREHPGYTSDGYHALKIKDEVTLEDYVESIIIPEDYQNDFADLIPDSLSKKVFYLKNDCEDIWEWSTKVYNFVSANT